METTDRADLGGWSPLLGEARFIRRTLIVIALVIASAGLLALLLVAFHVFLLLFAGILLAVLLRAPTDWLVNHTRLSEKAALAISMTALAVLFTLLAWLFAAPLADQLGQLSETLPKAQAALRKWMAEHAWTRPLMAWLAESQRNGLDAELVGKATGITLTVTFRTIVGVIVVLFIGVYLALQPHVYRRGFLRLVPEQARLRAAQVLDEIGTTLRRWLVGRLITMLIVGHAFALGLWWLAVPFAPTLGIVAGLLEFVPYLGPTLAAVPAILVAFNVEPRLALDALVLYVAIQGTENYLLSPLIEQRTVYLPPALVIFSTVLLAIVAGALGAALASPLAATLLVAVKRLYVQQVADSPNFR